MHKDIFQFPQHNELHGICWMSATPSSMKDTSRTALARRAVGPLEISGTTSPTRQGISPLLYALGFHTSLCLIDWLHCADLGVSQDWSGQVLWHKLPLFPREQLVASHPRVVQGVPWACVRGQPDSANDQA